MILTPLTAIIPTYNEEANIKRALDSVSFADEIIVIDSYSTDKTVDIVNDFGAKLIQRQFDDFSSQKNYAIQQATHQWIFILDADEEINLELKEEILSLLKDSINAYSGYYIYRDFIFKQHKIRFSGCQRDKVIRLFQKDKAGYHGLVHEKIVLKGKVGLLHERIKHFSYRNFSQYKKKIELYAKLQAQELFSKGVDINFYHRYIKPVLRFFVHYIIKLGVLDGIKGITYSYFMAYGVAQRYKELLALKRSKK